MSGKAIGAIVIGVALTYYAMNLNQTARPSAPRMVTTGESRSLEGRKPTELPAEKQAVQSPQSSDVVMRSSQITSFGDYTCSLDCSGHEAGYNWAEAHDIDDEDDCDTAGERSSSPSFSEGCKAFVQGDALTDADEAQDQDAKPVDADEEP